MNLEQVESQIEALNLEHKQKSAVLKLIDLKVENDMEKVLSEIKRLEDKQDAKFGAIESKFSTIIWAIGLLIAIIIGLKLFS